MAYKLDLVQNYGCVRLTLDGPIKRTELEQVLNESFVILARNSWDKILLDVMQIEETISMTELYVFVCLSAACTMMDARIAVLAWRDNLRVIGIIQDMEKDRGIAYRGFSDQDAALAWLSGVQVVRPEHQIA